MKSIQLCLNPSATGIRFPLVGPVDAGGQSLKRSNQSFLQVCITPCLYRTCILVLVQFLFTLTYTVCVLFSPDQVNLIKGVKAPEVLLTEVLGTMSHITSAEHFSFRMKCVWTIR